jgi:hypothetical protein
MYFCIRDDDTSFFTSPEDLERVYGEVIGVRPLAVVLSIVPDSKQCQIPRTVVGASLTREPAACRHLRTGIPQGA